MSFQNFYDDFYSSGISYSNPAHLIYDRLRIKKIQHYVSSYCKAITIRDILLIGSGRDLDYNLIDQEIFPSVRIHACDISFYALHKAASNKAVLVVADALYLPYISNSFDLIVCSEVLEHIPNVTQAISEIRRVIRNNGKLIVSSPNWLSLFGLTRYTGEKILRKPLHSAGQPYDDWKTYWKYTRELSPFFKVKDVGGVWYLPPMHFRGKGLSESLTNLIANIFSPVENILSKFAPIFGHSLIIGCEPWRRNQ